MEIFHGVENTFGKMSKVEDELRNASPELILQILEIIKTTSKGEFMEQLIAKFTGVSRSQKKEFRECESYIEGARGPIPSTVFESKNIYEQSAHLFIWLLPVKVPDQREDLCKNIAKSIIAMAVSEGYNLYHDYDCSDENSMYYWTNLIGAYYFRF